jgi:hypothetical protein
MVQQVEDGSERVGAGSLPVLLFPKPRLSNGLNCTFGALVSMDLSCFASKEEYLERILGVLPESEMGFVRIFFP